MRILRTLLLLVMAIALPALALAQNPANFPDRSVCDVLTDANGDCTPDALNDTVCVTGIVLAWKHFGTRGPGAIYDPASGCCISIFDITAAPDLAIGTTVEVCGWLGPFAGLAELVDNPASGTPDPTVTVIDPGPTPVDCTLIRSTDIAANNPGAEAKESCCVTICGSFVAAGTFAANTNYQFMDAYGDLCEVRIDGDTNIDGTAIPVGPVTVSGVLGQFDNFTNSCVGYQILPRALTDLSGGACTVDVAPSSWTRVKAVYRDVH